MRKYLLLTRLLFLMSVLFLSACASAPVYLSEKEWWIISDKIESIAINEVHRREGWDASQLCALIYGTNRNGLLAGCSVSVIEFSEYHKLPKDRHKQAYVYFDLKWNVIGYKRVIPPPSGSASAPKPQE